MKKYIILCLILYGFTAYSQDWVSVIKTTPYYSYSLPGYPQTLDTLNFRFSSFITDSLEIFQVTEFKDTPLDSGNVAFETALEQNGGDTLLAIAKSISVARNTTITDTLTITSFPAYKGIEVSMRYNDPYSGQTLYTFTRFFYNANTLLSFTVTGAEDEYQQLVDNKNQFFNSISL